MLLESVGRNLLSELGFLILALSDVAQLLEHWGQGVLLILRDKACFQEHALVLFNSLNCPFYSALNTAKSKTNLLHVLDTEL